jgi:hypothetical protein
VPQQDVLDLGGRYITAVSGDQRGNPLQVLDVRAERLIDLTAVQTPGQHLGARSAGSHSAIVGHRRLLTEMA